MFFDIYWFLNGSRDILCHVQSPYKMSHLSPFTCQQNIRIPDVDISELDPKSRPKVESGLSGLVRILGQSLLVKGCLDHDRVWTVWLCPWMPGRFRPSKITRLKVRNYCIQYTKKIKNCPVINPRIYMFDIIPTMHYI